MVLANELYRRELVRLTDVSQELTVGVGGATASVRTLNDVSLVIRSRELVVLSGSRGAGERAMLAVIAGDRRGVTGTCTLHANTRVRVLRISAQAAFALTEEWQRSETLYQSDNGSTRTNAAAHAGAEPVLSTDHTPLDLFLLDVVGDNGPSVAHHRSAAGSAHSTNSTNSTRSTRSTRSTDSTNSMSANSANRRPMYGGVAESTAHTPRPWNEKNRTALLAWVSVCRQRGGAVVMAAGESLGHGLFDSALTHVRSALAAPRASSVRELRFAPSTVRVVAMHCGRLAASVPLHTRELAQ